MHDAIIFLTVCSICFSPHLAVGSHPIDEGHGCIVVEPAGVGLVHTGGVVDGLPHFPVTCLIFNEASMNSPAVRGTLLIPTFAIRSLCST